MGNKLTLLDAIENETIDVVVSILAQYDEYSFLPVLETIHDVALSYFKNKYGDIISVEELDAIRAEIKRTEGVYEISKSEVEHIDSIKISINKKFSKGDEQLPFE